MHTKHRTIHRMTWVVATLLVVASTGWATSPQPNSITCIDADETVTLSYEASSIWANPNLP